MPGFEGLLAGRTLCERYRIEEVIGRGGFAAVYRATDQRLGRTVAVKVITFSATNPVTRDEVHKRFRREARAIASLHHPNVVTVYDFGTDPVLGLEFIVMELLQGEDLAHRMARPAPIPLRMGVRMLRDAALGVDAGHRAGLVHRDIKPGNIFLAKRDRPGRFRVCVLDFGIARLTVTDEATQLTRAGGMLLSPAYASPEQLHGEVQVTPASDVFSLGVIGYELLTRERPFPGNRLQAPTGIAPVPLRERNPEVPPEIADAIHRAMAEDPAERFATAGAFAEALAMLDVPGEAPAHAAAIPAGEPELESVAAAAPAMAPAVEAPPVEMPQSAPPPAPQPPPEEAHTVRYSREALAERAPVPGRGRDRQTRRRAAVLALLLVGGAGVGWMALAADGAAERPASPSRRPVARRESPAPPAVVTPVPAAAADSAADPSATAPAPAGVRPEPAAPRATRPPVPAGSAPGRTAPPAATPPGASRTAAAPRTAAPTRTTVPPVPPPAGTGTRVAARTAPPLRAPAGQARTPRAAPATPAAAPRLATPERLNREGETLFERNEVAGAVERFKTAVRAAPGNAYYRNNLGWALFQMGEVDAAGRELEETVRLDPRRAIAYANLGEVRAAQGDTAAAIAMYERFVELNGDPRRERIAQGKLRRLRGG